MKRPNTALPGETNYKLWTFVASNNQQVLKFWKETRFFVENVLKLTSTQRHANRKWKLLNKRTCKEKLTTMQTNTWALPWWCDMLIQKGHLVLFAASRMFCVIVATFKSIFCSTDELHDIYFIKTQLWTGIHFSCTPGVHIQIFRTHIAKEDGKIITICELCLSFVVGVSLISFILFIWSFGFI